jgi:nicotinamidase-related amidase
MKNFRRNEIILKKEKSALLLIDIQERILDVQFYKDNLLTNSLKLIKGFKALNLPIFYTEQYPKGLGETALYLKPELENITAIQKLSFSCFGAENLFDELNNKKIKQIVVAGIEAHVCVQQTVLDLLANDFQVNLAADAVSSRKEIDYRTALNRMQLHGAEITTTEAALFELLEVCGTPEFKAVSKIVK